MYNEVLVMVKKLLWSSSKFYPRIHLEGPSKTYRNLGIVGTQKRTQTGYHLNTGKVHYTTGQDALYQMS